MKRIFYFVFFAIACCACGSTLEVNESSRNTTVSIVGEEFYINGKPTFEGKTWRGYNIQGLLPNSRMVNGIFDDLNDSTRSKWAYPDTKVWDAERNNREFIEAMPIWREHNLLAFTINLQGGDPIGYHPDQPWINSAFRSDGSLIEEYMVRLEKILDRADELGMVAIVGVFYCAQERIFEDEEAIKTGLKNACKWVLDKGYTNVIIEVGNESDILFQQPILLWEKSEGGRVHELIELAKTVTDQSGRRLLVSTSYSGGIVPDEASAKASDFLLIHGNRLESPTLILKQMREVRLMLGNDIKPIVYNEDDNYCFEEEFNNFTAATSQHASWGYFDYRVAGDSLNVGFQSLPANWTISSTRKAGFFNLIKEWGE